jgi:hypothetical protein
MNIEWEDGFSISVNANSDEVMVSANRAGLLSLARQLTALANEEPGAHIHYDTYNSLEDGSKELVVELTSD